MIFTVRLDTFVKEDQTKVFYIGTNDPSELTEIRCHMLAHFKDLPIYAGHGRLLPSEQRISPDKR
jgi:D-lactate dehydrogenase